MLLRSSVVAITDTSAEKFVCDPVSCVTLRRGITGRTSGERGFTTSLLKKQNLALVGVSSIRLRFVWELGLSTAGVVISLPLDTPEVCLKGSEQASSMRSEGGIAAFDCESSRGCGGGGDGACLDGREKKAFHFSPSSILNSAVEVASVCADAFEFELDWPL